MTYRALELLNLPPEEPAFLLDIGCGSGLSGEILDQEGYAWVGVDIAPSMLGRACLCFLCFLFGWRLNHHRGCIREGSRGRSLSTRYRTRIWLSTRKFWRRYKVRQFGLILLGSLEWIQITYSISVLQWLLNAETSHHTSSPPHRLHRFFTTLHSALRNPSRAVFQFYPSSDDQIQLITSIAQKAGFGGGIVVDYPNSKKAKKVFLCLFVGGGGGQQEMPKGLEGVEEEGSKVRFERRRDRERLRGKGGIRKKVKDKDWILKKKEVRFHVSVDFLCSCSFPSAVPKAG